MICTKWIQITRVQLRVLRNGDQGGSSENDHPGKLGTPNFTSRVLCNWVTSACTYVFWHRYVHRYLISLGLFRRNPLLNVKFYTYFVEGVGSCSVELIYFFRCVFRCETWNITLSRTRNMPSSSRISIDGQYRPVDSWLSLLTCYMNGDNGLQHKIMLCIFTSLISHINHIIIFLLRCFVGTAIF